MAAAADAPIASTAAPAGQSPVPSLSVIVPMLDEVLNVRPMVEGISAALRPSGRSFEIIIVDDGSTDGTTEEIATAMAEWPELRGLRHENPHGQSAAIQTGVQNARATLIATIDGDCQNDPADIPMLIDEHARLSQQGGTAMAAGQRQKRRDRWIRRVSSRLANGARSRILGDGVEDSACGLKVFDRELFLALPVFSGKHRFLPALAIMHGASIGLVPVNHRPRTAGVAKYGVWNRFWVGLGDMAMVFWLKRRYRRPSSVRELAPASAGDTHTGMSPVADSHAAHRSVEQMDTANRA